MFFSHALTNPTAGKGKSCFLFQLLFWHPWIQRCWTSILLLELLVVLRMHACVLVILFSLCNIVSLIFRLLKQNVWVIIACSEPRHDVSWCVNYISGQIIIFHQSRFPWNKAICWGFPYYPTIWGEVVWGRYYLPRYKDMFFFWRNLYSINQSTHQPINHHQPSSTAH